LAAQFIGRLFFIYNIGRKEREKVGKRKEKKKLLPLKKNSIQ
jgi:hypothetical protein